MPAAALFMESAFDSHTESGIVIMAGSFLFCLLYLKRILLYELLYDIITANHPSLGDLFFKRAVKIDEG